VGRDCRQARLSAGFLAFQSTRPRGARLQDGLAIKKHFRLFQSTRP